MDKTVITVTGKDTTGIIAGISKLLFEHKANILDISQTIRMGIFNMMMIVDTEDMDLTYSELVQGMSEIANQLGVDIRCQKEEIFNMMHRI